MRWLASRLLPLLLLLVAFSDAGATPLAPAFDLQGPGLVMAVGGVGLQGWHGGPRSLTVTIRGTVELALLYWAGRDYPCPEEPPGSGRCVIPHEPYKDQILTFDGVPLAGTLIGSEAQPDANPGAVDNLGYMADVTDRVRAKGAGRQVFQIGDGEPGNDLSILDGAGLLVLSRTPAGTAARVIVFHGLDFAYGEDRTPGASQITAPVALYHGAARADRQGTLVLFAGDAQATAHDRVDVSANPSLSDRLAGSAGAQWDAGVFPVTIPRDRLSTTVQIASEPVGRNPDSLLWVMAALRVPLPVPTGCAESYWLGHPDAWTIVGIYQTQLLRNTFVESAGYGTALGGTSLRGALRLRGGADLQGAARTLLRAAVPALLNAAHPDVEYPYTRTQVITAVDDALRSRDAASILALARTFAGWNAAECPLH